MKFGAFRSGQGSRDTPRETLDFERERYLGLLGASSSLEIERHGIAISSQIYCLFIYLFIKEVVRTYLV